MVSDPENVLKKWFIDSHQTKYDAIAREFQRVQDQLYGPGMTHMVLSEFRVLLNEMFPKVEGDRQGNIWREHVWVEIEDKLNAFESDLNGFSNNSEQCSSDLSFRK